MSLASVPRGFGGGAAGTFFGIGVSFRLEPDDALVDAQVVIVIVDDVVAPRILSHRRLPSPVSVESVSTLGRSPGVADGAAHEHPACHVDEWKASLVSLLSEPADDFVDATLALVAAPGVHLIGVAPAGAVRLVSNADA
jgi:hypothetical protein